MIESKYKSNNNVVYSCKYHVIFCPKYRRKILVGDIAKRAKQIFKEVAKEKNIDIIEMEVMSDHVHLLLEVDPQFGIHRAVKTLKGRTSFFFVKNFEILKANCHAFGQTRILYQP